MKKKRLKALNVSINKIQWFYILNDTKEKATIVGYALYIDPFVRQLIVPQKIGKATVTGINCMKNPADDRINEVVVPEGVISIRGDSFRYCRNLATVSLPTSIKYLDDTAFSNTPWKARLRAEEAKLENEASEIK